MLSVFHIKQPQETTGKCFQKKNICLQQSIQTLNEYEVFAYESVSSIGASLGRFGYHKHAGKAPAGHYGRQTR
jgi:hypothetical protein